MRQCLLICTIFALYSCGRGDVEYTPQQIDSLYKAAAPINIKIHENEDEDRNWSFESVCYTDDGKNFYPMIIRYEATDSVVYVKGTYTSRYRVLQSDVLKEGITQIQTMKMDYNWHDSPEIRSIIFLDGTGSRRFIKINNRTFFNKIPTK